MEGLLTHGVSGTCFPRYITHVNRIHWYTYPLLLAGERTSDEGPLLPARQELNQQRPSWQHPAVNSQRHCTL